MSGHSKWSQIRRQKGVTDQKRGQLFTKAVAAIAIAAREDQNPETNFKLRLAIEEAKNINMPKENIERAKIRGSGKLGQGHYEEITYEGFGPAGVGIIIDCLTDNRQRTSQEIRSVLERYGGNLAAPASVSWMFSKSIVLTIEAGEETESTITDAAIAAGAADLEKLNSEYLIYTTLEDMETVKKKLLEEGLPVKNSLLIKKPKTSIQITDPKTADSILKLVESIENLKDVQKVYSNFDIPEEILLRDAEIKN